MPINPYGGSYTTAVPTYPNSYTWGQSVPQPSQNNIVSMVLVNSEEEARNYNLVPGGSIFLMDSNNQVFYTKSVDFSGIATFKKYKFEEVSEQVPESRDYITREEFDELKDLIKKQYKPYKKERRDESSN